LSWSGAEEAEGGVAALAGLLIAEELREAALARKQGFAPRPCFPTG
jgi:hypothetical protein